MDRKPHTWLYWDNTAPVPDGAAVVDVVVDLTELLEDADLLVGADAEVVDAATEVVVLPPELAVHVAIGPPGAV